MIQASDYRERPVENLQPLTEAIYHSYISLQPKSWTVLCGRRRSIIKSDGLF